MQGIAALAKKFPEFEAYFVDGEVFDMREALSFHDNTDATREDMLKLRSRIQKEFWEFIRPPCRKMYIVAGAKWPNDKGLMESKGETVKKIYTEFAVDVERVGKNLVCHRLYVYDHRRQGNMEMMARYANVEIIPAEVYGFTEKRVAWAHWGRHLDKNNWRGFGQNFGFGNLTGEEDLSIMLPELEIVDELAWRFNLAPGKVLVKMGLMGEDSRKAAIRDFDLMAAEDISDFATTLVFTLFFLNVKNVVQVEQKIPVLRNYYWPKNWGRVYKTLSLTQTLKRRGPGAGDSIPTGMKYRAHFQRGHFKKRRTGIFWWNPHWRGDWNRGQVVKDYVAKNE